MPSTMNLLLQVVILGVLLYGVIMVKKGRINSHGMVIFSAFILNTISILVVMLPSAIRIIGGAAQSIFSLIVVIHIILGFLVEGLGAYIITRWRFHPPGITCFSMKGLMRILTSLWVLSVILGIIVFYYLL
jgi:uncharacterized membrane protein YozB (DUF420 family)